jgi:integrase/recombinase XerC
VNLLRRNSVEPIDAYLYQLEQLGKSPHTLRSYRGTLYAWVASGLSAENYILSLSQTRKKSSLNVARAILSAYHNWLIRVGKAKTNPISRTLPAKVPQRILRTLTVSEVARLIDACQMVGSDKQTLVPTKLPVYEYRLRLQAMVAVQVTSGLRVAELCRLFQSDVDTQGRWATVVGKGDKERRVRFGRVAQDLLEEWQSVWLDEPLFCGIAPRSYYRQLQEAARWAELEDVHPHTLRHTFATMAVDSGIPVADVQQMLGHSQVATTMKYVHRAPERGWDRFSQHPLESV